MLTRADNQKAYLALFADTDYLLASTTIANGSFIVAAQPDFPRNITINVTTSTITAGTVTVTGADPKGITISEVLNLALATTLTGTKNFALVTSIVVAGLVGNDPGDTFIVGVGANVQLTTGRSTLVYVVVGSGSGTVGKYQFIDGTTGTTTDAAELKAAIAAGVYDYNASFANGIRIILSGDTPLTVVYNQ